MENWLWKRLWTCRKIGCVLNELVDRFARTAWFSVPYGIVGKASVFVNGVFLVRDVLYAVMMWPVTLEMSTTSIGILYCLRRQ
jgi:hypothetical protein